MLKNIFVIILTISLVSCSTSSNLKTLNQTFAAREYQVNEEGYWQGSSPTIWNRLSHTSLASLETAPPSSDPIVNGWIKLAIISKTYSANSKNLTYQLQLWRAAYPKHPGNAIIPNGTAFASLSTQIPMRIALLLPLKGHSAAAGQAVRDGFLNAYYQSETRTNVKQTISFYDTSSTRNIYSLYRQAVASGADFIVGPLLREDVETLTRTASFNVPTLELNYTNSSLPNNVWQFGLSSLDEALQVADKVKNAGKNKAIVIAPKNDWGANNVNTFSKRWLTLGGTISATYYFSTNSNLSQDIAKLMRIHTNQDLEKKRRQDFDVIVLLAQPQSARQIVPLLKYYHAENIPIYATSSIYSGAPNPAKDKDLDGVIFSDIPWILENNQSNRLFAVGRDAYLLTSELSRLTKLPNFPLYASTGALTISPTHKVYRRLPWAKMHEGKP